MFFVRKDIKSYKNQVINIIFNHVNLLIECRSETIHIRKVFFN